MTDDDRSAGRRAHGVVRAPSDGRTIALGDAGVVTLKAVRSDTGGTVSAYEFAMPPTTAGPPLHRHRGWDEVFFVLAGEMTFLIDGQRSTAPAGTFVFVPPSWCSPNRRPPMPLPGVPDALARVAVGHRSSPPVARM